MRILTSNFPVESRCGVIPAESPTVPMAETASKMILRNSPFWVTKRRLVKMMMKDVEKRRMAMDL
jgi:hypothetical protein